MSHTYTTTIKDTDQEADIIYVAYVTIKNRLSGLKTLVRNVESGVYEGYIT